MSATTHRAAALAAFVSLSILPTAGTTYWAYYVNRPDHASEIADRLSDRLRYIVELASVSFPRPGETEYHELVLRDTDHHGVTTAIECLRTKREGRRWRLDADGVSVNLAEPSQDAPQPGWSRDHRNLVETFFGRCVPPDVDELVLSVSELSVEAARQTYAVDRAKLRYYVDRLGKPHLAGVFRLAGRAPRSPASLELVLRSRSDLAVEIAHLRTGAAGLPASVAMPFADFDRCLGPDARLHGSLAGRHTSEGWDWSFQGSATRVDLDRLVGEASSYRFTGVSDWSIDRFLWHRGRVQHMRGRVEGGPGNISAELLNVLTQEAGFAAGRRVPTRGTVAYDRFAFDFRMKRGALELRASPRGHPVMTGPHDQTLLHGPLGAGSLLSFARALSRRSGRPAVQASYAPERLMQILPIEPAGDRSHVEVRQAGGSLAESTETD